MKITTLFLIWIIVANAMFLSGCGNKFKTAYNTSANISGIVKTSATTVGELFTSGAISFEVKEQIINKLKFIQKNNEEVFLKEINAVWNLYKTNPPTTVLSHLDLIFNQSVINPLLDLLNYVGANNPKILAALAALKVAIFSIAAIFSSSMSEYKLGKSKSFEAILPVMSEGELVEGLA